MHTCILHKATVVYALRVYTYINENFVVYNENTPHTLRTNGNTFELGKYCGSIEANRQIRIPSNCLYLGHVKFVCVYK